MSLIVSAIFKVGIIINGKLPDDMVLRLFCDTEGNSSANRCRQGEAEVDGTPVVLLPDSEVLPCVVEFPLIIPCREHI